ncbi:MAG: SNF2-related protein [Candidatus Desantisbacteria bacterium]
MRNRGLLVNIDTYRPMIEAMVVGQKSDRESEAFAGKMWMLDNRGIYTECDCARKCKNNIKIIQPELIEHIEKQLVTEIRRFGREFNVVSENIKFFEVTQNKEKIIINDFSLQGLWKDRRTINNIRQHSSYKVEKSITHAKYEEYIYNASRAIEKRRFEEAKVMLNQAIRLDPEAHAAYCFLSRIFASQNRLKQAEDCLKIALTNARKQNENVKEVEQELEKIKAIRHNQKPSILPPVITHEEKYQPNIGVKIVFDENNEKVLDRFTRNIFETEHLFNLILQGQQLSLLQGFDTLLCLESINIDHYSYQIDTARRVLGRFSGRAILADEVGLGKTIEAGLIMKEYIIRGLVNRVLILTVPSLVSQWKEEMSCKFGLEFVTTEDMAFRRDKDFWQNFPLIIASLNLAKGKLHQEIIHSIEYDLIIVDEAHHLRSSASLGWKFVSSIKKKFILLLTATPVQNSIEDIYNMITILKPGQLDTIANFRKEFVTRGNSKQPKNRERLRELISEVMIRNTRSNVDLKLPRRYAKTINLTLSSQEMLVYQGISNMVRQLYQTPSVLNKLILLTIQREVGSSISSVLPTLQKIIQNPHLPKEIHQGFSDIYELAQATKENVKVEALRKIIASTSDKYLVFTHFLETQNFMNSYLDKAGIQASLFNGKMSAAEKEASIKEFQGSSRVLISTEAGGEGRNLQFCHKMVNYDLPWNPMKIEQRIGRIHRVGQKCETYIYNLSSQDTIEAYILKLLDEKINMFELVIGEMDMLLGDMETEIEFEEKIMEIWTNSNTKEELEKNIDEFGNVLQGAKAQYLEVKGIEDTLFGEEYEVEG